MAYVVGLDLGQTSDYSAVAVLEQSSRPHPRIVDQTENHYLCAHLERVPLGTPYTAIVDRVATLMRTPPLPGCTLAVDQTGVGRPVVDMFKLARIPCWLRPVTITGGANVSIEPNGDIHVPKKELVSTLQVLLQFRRLRVVGRLPDARTLEKELQNFRIKITAAANETFGAWREGQHDDLVLAVAIAAWLGENTAISWDGKIGLPSERKMNVTAAAPRGVFHDAGEAPSPW